MKKILVGLFVFVSLVSSHQAMAWRWTASAIETGSNYTFSAEGNSPLCLTVWQDGASTGTSFTSDTDTLIIPKTSLPTGSSSYAIQNALSNCSYKATMSYSDFVGWQGGYFDSMYTGGILSIVSAPVPVLGCMTSSATNYNPLATQDNGSCTYSSGGGSTGAITNSSITTIGLSAIQTFGLSALMLLGALILLLGAFFLYKWMTRKIFSPSSFSGHSWSAHGAMENDVNNFKKHVRSRRRRGLPY